MYTYIQKYVKFNREKGLSLLEVATSCIIFGLFLVGVYATMDVGLKSWQMGETKTNLHQRVEILLNRIVKEVTYSNVFSLQLSNSSDPNTNPYLCFESAINKSSNNFILDRSSDGMGCPVWQGYILYYLNKDPSDVTKKNVYRQFVDRDNPSIQPCILSPISNYITVINSSNVKTVVKDIYSMNLGLDENVLTVEVSFRQHIRTGASVAFSPGMDGGKGTEIITMKSTVKVKN